MLRSMTSFGLDTRRLELVLSLLAPTNQQRWQQANEDTKKGDGACLPEFKFKREARERFVVGKHLMLVVEIPRAARVINPMRARPLFPRDLTPIQRIMPYANPPAVARHTLELFHTAFVASAF